MGLILIPSEVMNCAEELRNFLAQNADSYSGTMQKVQSFSWNTELKTVTYDTLKEKLPMVHGIIVQTMMMAQESVNSDLSILESSVGNEDLFEDELVLQIERLNAECRNYENIISNLQELCSNPFIEMLGFVSSYLSELIESNHALLEHTRAEIARLEEKLDFLYEVSNSTKGLFQTGIDLFGMADNAIHDAVVTITGVGNYSNAELDWKILLPAIIEKTNNIEENVDEVEVNNVEEEKSIDEKIQNIWDPITVDRINQLHPDVQEAAIDFILEAQEQGIYLRITSGYRSVDEQNELYAQGRTEPGIIVTNARGGESYHNYGVAFDVVEIKDGEALWNNEWKEIGEIGKKYGFEWGGDWISFVDLPHFQMTFGYDESELWEMYNEDEMENGYVILKDKNIKQE